MAAKLSMEQSEEETGEKHHDPVSGKEVSDADTALDYEFKGDRYYFCSRNCRERFEADPEKYLNPENDSGETEGQTYTFPMHPEVRQDSPGDCPNCGMALEPEAPEAPRQKTEWTCPMHPEIVRKVDTLVVDKTGTLTEGKPKLTDVVAVKPTDEQTLPMLAASLEKSSERPLAAAIVARAGERDIELISWPKSCPRTRPKHSRIFKIRAALSPWPGTALTVHPPWPRPRSASPWARGRMWPWRVHV
jgi:YHS domain-containing protein